jgi:hypothetical protein
MMVIPFAVRVAAVLSWINAFGLGIPCLMAIRNLSAGRDLPLVFGFTAYGGGAFERRGHPTTIPLLAGFLLVCVVQLFAGWLLWKGQPAGAVLALMLIVPGAVYWWGFDLPYPPILAAIQAILIVFGWSGLM